MTLAMHISSFLFHWHGDATYTHKKHTHVRHDSTSDSPYAAEAEVPVTIVTLLVPQRPAPRFTDCETSCFGVWVGFGD